MKGTLLIIDDEDTLRSLLARILELEDYHVLQAANAEKGLGVLARESDIALVITDVKLPDANGVELTQKIKARYSIVEIIVLTYGTIADGVKAIQKGAFDYITKDDDNDKIIPLVS